MSDFSRWQTDLLFLLVGTNPLPNYVASQLLAKPGGLVVLLHSRETSTIAEDLAGRINKRLPGLQPVLTREIHHADADVIHARLRAVVSELNPGSRAPGLHYTGGTKPMAVHAYHFFRDKYPDGCFSYLDATTLQMYIQVNDARIQKVSTAHAVEIGLEELLGLHGYYLQKSPLRQQPRAPDLCRAILQVYRNQVASEQWKHWLATLRQSEPRLPEPGAYPALKPVIAAFQRLAGGSEPPEGAVARALGYEKLGSCHKFFTGEWLEEYTLQAVVDLSANTQIHDWGINALTLLEADRQKPKELRRRSFEVDVAAMVGYQLFAISCQRAQKPDSVKEHLLEAFVRARQMGGDEARVAVVCRVQNSVLLQREIEREEEETRGKVRVFGMQQLPGLAGQLRTWIQTANREGV